MTSEPANSKQPRIAIVGPCSSGKSTLRHALQEAGYHDIRNPAQEHSYVPDMWRKITRPDLLIYLDIDYATSLARRPHQDHGPQRLETQYERLAHARAHADFYVDTGPLTPEEVAEVVLAFLGERGGRE